jgi:putative transposase
MCHVLEVSRSRYYDWRRDPESARARETQRLDAAIRRLFEVHKGRAGSPKITRYLREEGWRVGENRVAKRMREMGLRSKVRRAYRTTTNSRHDQPVAPDRLQREFTVSGPDQVYVSDLTYLRTRSGWLYLTVVLDLYSRLVVGWALSDSLSHHAVLKALRRAIARRRPSRGLICHSDRGIQYACTDFRQLLDHHGFRSSMARKGDPWDNAVAESFFCILKSELVHQSMWDGYTDAHRDLFEYLEVYYNRERIHSTLGWVTPAQYQAQAVKVAA